METLFEINENSKVTKNGYERDEVVSSLQKAIRRGHEGDALFWALELEESGDCRYLWSRLLVIASEDIGYWSQERAILVESLRNSYFFVTFGGKRITGSGEVILAHAVLALSRACKNREVDDFLSYIKMERKKGMRLQVPDYALDMHTKAGRNLGRDLVHFYEEGARLVNEHGENKYREEVLKWAKEKSK